MILVGICGAISSGKSTFAELLTAVDAEHSLHLETSTVVVELANTFNKTLSTHLAEIQPDADLVPIANQLIEALMPQIQAMTDAQIKKDQLIIDAGDMASHPEWYEKLFVYLGQVQQIPSIVEQQISAENKSNYRPLLQWIGGYFLYKLDDNLLWYKELLRRAHNASDDVTLVAMTAPRQPAEAKFIQQAGGKVIKIIRPGLENDTSDVTERMVASIKPDVTITNGGSIKDLQKTAQTVHHDLLADELKQKYSAR